MIAAIVKSFANSALEPVGGTRGSLRAAGAG